MNMSLSRPARILFCALTFCTWAAAQTLVNVRPCPSGDAQQVLTALQYYLTAEVALAGAKTWVKENPTQFDAYYNGALQPQTAQGLGGHAAKAFRGEAQHGDLNNFLLNAKWQGGQSADEKNWHRFLSESDGAAKLDALAKVDVGKLQLYKKTKTPLEPWLYLVMKRETAAIIQNAAKKVPADEPYANIAKLADMFIRGTLKNEGAAFVNGLTVPAGLAGKPGLADAVAKLMALDSLPENYLSLFTIKDGAGVAYDLLKGEAPKPQRPEGLSREQMVTWRKNEAHPHRMIADFLVEAAALKMISIGEFATAKRLVEHHDLENSRAKCSYDPGTTLALLRYGADVLRPEGHYQERNYLNTQKFSAYQFLFQLEIEPTSGGVKF